MSFIGNSQFQGDQVKPKIIGHRGFRGKFPENTVLAMRQGVAVGAQVIETDIQLSSDGVVVMCHDVDTGRCFNKNYEVEKTPYYGVLDQLHTTDKYQEPMPTLQEVASMFMHDETFKDTILMIDVKRSNGPHVVPYMIKVLESVAPLSEWASRCTLGVWRLPVLKAVETLCPELPVTFIGCEQRTARSFMEHDVVKGISVNYASLACTGGPELMDEARLKGVKLYSWTVNDPEPMKWAVAARLEGLITDYPDVLEHFLSTIDEKDMMSEYFTSEPRKFYSPLFMIKLWSIYLVATWYLAVADTFPTVFTRI